METKQAILPLSAPISTSMLLCIGNRHNHITVCDETIFISPMALYQQAMFVAIHCREPLVGVPPNPGIRRKYSAAVLVMKALRKKKPALDSEMSQMPVS